MMPTRTARSRVRPVSTPDVAARSFLGIVLLCLGFPDRAWARCNAAIARARRLAHPPSPGVSLFYGAKMAALVGDAATLEVRARQLLALADEQGFRVERALATLLGGWVAIRGGKVAEGLGQLHGGLTAYRALGSEVWTSLSALLADACRIAAQDTEAMTLLDDALKIAARTGKRWFAAELNRLKSELLRRQGKPRAAEELYECALGIAGRQRARLWELCAATSLARLCRDEGRGGQARDVLAPICAAFTEGLDTPDFEAARALLTELP